jgi:hypothetical protein
MGAGIPAGFEAGVSSVQLDSMLGFLIIRLSMLGDVGATDMLGKLHRWTNRVA